MTLTELRTSKRTRATTDTPAVSRAWSIALAASWLVALPVIDWLEPAAREATPWWGSIVQIGFTALIVATFAGLVRRKTFGVGTSVVGSLVLTTGAFLCPATGHHAFGLWWIGQFAVCLGLVALSCVAYLRTR